MRLSRLSPGPDTPVRAALRAVDARVRLDFRRAVFFAALACTVDAISHFVGGVAAGALHDRLIAYGCAAAFVVFGIAATRSAASELARVSLHRAGPSAATALRVAVLLLGYLVVGLTTLDLFAVPVGRLVVGGAVTGVILGIAAQQTLSNVFAGLVLLFARPYVPGEAIRIRSGALGGTMDGTVTTVGLLYTTLETLDGQVNIPNGALLAAAVGPYPAPARDAAPDTETAVRSADQSAAPRRPRDGERAVRHQPAVPPTEARGRRDGPAAAASTPHQRWSSSTVTRSKAKLAEVRHDRDESGADRMTDSEHDAAQTPADNTAAIEGAVAGWRDTHADNHTLQLPPLRS